MTYLRQAGAKAVARSANREAVGVLRAGAGGARPSARDPRDAGAGHRPPVRSPQRALAARRVWRRSFGHLRDAERWPRRSAISDGWDGRRVHGQAHPADGARGGRSRFAERALAIAERARGSRPPSRPRTTTWAAPTTAPGDYRQAAMLPSRIAQLLDGDLVRERCGLAGSPAVMSRPFSRWPWPSSGEFDEAIAHGREEAIRLAEALDHPYSLACACSGLGQRLPSPRGTSRKRSRCSSAALALCREWHLTVLVGGPSIASWAARMHCRAR